MRSIGHEPPLMLEGIVETNRVAIERQRKLAEFVLRFSDSQPVLHIFRANAFRLVAHGDDGRKAASCQEIATNTRKAIRRAE